MSGVLVNVEVGTLVDQDQAGDVEGTEIGIVGTDEGDDEAQLQSDNGDAGGVRIRGGETCSWRWMSKKCEIICLTNH